LLPHNVAYFYAVEGGSTLGIKKMTLEGRDVKTVFDGICVVEVWSCVFVLERVARVNQGKEAGKAFVKEEAVFGVLPGEAAEFQVPEDFKAIALLVHTGFGNIAQLGTGFEVEEEEHAVHNPEAFPGERSGVEPAFFGGAEDLYLFDFPKIADGFVSQELDAFAQGVFEVFAYAIGVFVGVFVQGVEDALPLAGCKTFLVEEAREHAQG
jgi:hypothetical protein